jgi:hypothetical protein
MSSNESKSMSKGQISTIFVMPFYWHVNHEKCLVINMDVDKSKLNH